MIVRYNGGVSRQTARTAVRVLVFVVPLFSPIVHAASESRPAPKPNLIFILADDLGYGDLSCFQSDKIETPHLDELARSGMRWTQFYAAAAVCTPTRASCLTGRYPLRFGITKHFKDGTEHLPRGTMTLPKLLRQAGYVTAHVGKWHLGGLNKAHVANRKQGPPGPHEHGFDHYLCMNEEHEPRGRLLKTRRLYRDGTKYLFRNDQPAPYVERHWTDYKIDECLELIETCHRQGRPFFLNLWSDVPHTPYEPAPEPFLGPYKDRAKGDDLLYRSMVTHLDHGIGRIVAKLEQLGIAGDTLIIFTSDNGPSYQGSPGPWKGGKADLHEGGIRVPMIARWPGKIKAGSVCGELGHTNDLLPTFCEAAGIRLPDELKIDGMSLWPRLHEGKALSRNGIVFWQLDLYKWFAQPGEKPKPYATEIARQGKWKLMAKEGIPVGLFDLEKDPREQNNRLNEEPQVRDALTQALREWLSSARPKKVQSTSTVADH